MQANHALQPAAIVFDLFGTLLDIASLGTAAARHTSDAAAFVATWREKQLAYAFAATIMDRYENFDALTERALRYAAARHGLTLDAHEFEALAAEWCRAQPFNDAQSALAQLRERGLRCAVLTNGTPATARAALDASGLSGSIEVTLSVESVRAYKPAARVYALATAHYAALPEQLVFVTSNGWDATGAANFGLRVVWCNRTGAPAETFGAAPYRTISGLHDLPNALAQVP
jgi:2-haloacid dehalogenase